MTRRILLYFLAGTLCALLAALGGCASREIEERMHNPKLRDLFPPLEPAPQAAEGKPAPAAGGATGEAAAAAGAQAPAAGQTGEALTFSPPKLDAPNAEQPAAPAVASNAAPPTAAPAAPSAAGAAAAPSAAGAAAAPSAAGAAAAPSVAGAAALPSAAVAAAAPSAAPAAAPGAGGPWPRAITAGGVAFEVYEPQLQSWDGSALVADAVVTAQPAGSAEHSVGAVRVTARTKVDRAAGQVALEDIQIPQARFQATPAQQAAWVELLRTAAPRHFTRVSLERLEKGAALMRARESTRGTALPGNPRIVLARNPVAVVNIDGEPQLVNISGTKLQGVINTRVLLLKDAEGKYYLRVYDGWMGAPTLRGPWTLANAPAGSDVAQDIARTSDRVDWLRGAPDPKTGALPSLARQLPNVVVTTQLTVVIGVNGQAKWAAIPGTKLEYVTNTKANVFRDAAARRVYVLARGRWFQGTSTGAATMEFVPATKLPADFGRIPSGHPKAGVRAYLQDAQEPGLEALAETPTVKEVSRKEAKFNVTVDGEPRFKPIEGTQLSYVANASAPIIRVAPNRYYGVQNGVWFTSQYLIGGWVLADDVPAEIYAIPPSSPIYHAVNSRVYATSTDKVYYGYNSDPAGVQANLGATGVAASDASKADVYYGYGNTSGPLWGWQWR
jgi:hypothetical protein